MEFCDDDTTNELQKLVNKKKLHMTLVWGLTLSHNLSSLAFAVWESQCFENDSISQLINE